MTRIVVLGGCGGIGTVASRALSAAGAEVVIADLDERRASELAAEFGAESLTLDASSPESLSTAMDGAEVVLNCVGPFYRFGPPTLGAALAAGVNYVDVCDDLDATKALLAMDADARAAGVTALVGMGNSPGLANIFVKMCAEQLLDEVHSVDICHVHGGEPSEGAAVLKHRIHAMVDDVPLFVDGGFVAVRQLEDSGREYVREIDFPGVGPYPVYPYPHPETITLPTAFPTLRRATNLGSVYPLPYFAMTQDLVRAGMAAEGPLDVPVAGGGQVTVTPIDAMVALIQRERPRLLDEAGVTGAGGCLRVEVGGVKDGEDHTYICSLNSEGAGAGEGTGIPAALGAALMLRGVLGERPGVHPPEAIVDVDELLALAGTVANAMAVGDGDGIPLTVEHLGPDGVCEVVPMKLG